jgi:hypothetical protein
MTMIMGIITAITVITAIIAMTVIGPLELIPAHRWPNPIRPSDPRRRAGIHRTNLWLPSVY